MTRPVVSSSHRTSRPREIRMVVPIALKETIEALAPEIEADLGLSIASTHMLNPEVPDYIKRNQGWDIAFSNPWHLEEVLDEPSVDASSHHYLGYSPLAFGAHTGEGGSETGRTLDAVRDALMVATRIAITDTGTSGARFDELVSALQLDEAIHDRVLRLGGGEPMKALLDGAVDLVALPLSNIAPIPQVIAKAICPLPPNAEIDLSLCTSAVSDHAVADLVAWLLAPERKPRLASLGVVTRQAP